MRKLLLIVFSVATISVIIGSSIHVQAQSGAPDAPAAIGAIGVSAKQISISWANSASTIQETGYKLYRNGVYIATTPYIPDSDIWREPSLYQDVNLTPDTSYTYYVTAIGADGAESAPSMSVTARTKDASQTGLIPPDRKVDWIPGVTVGVPGGIPNWTNMIDVRQAPYYVTGSTQTTTGTIENGSNTLTVTSIADFAVGQTIGIKNATTHIYDNNMIIDLSARITNISGNTITISEAAKATAQNTQIWHDDSGAINRAITEAPANSVVLLPEGSFGSIYIARSNVAVRGAGMDRTLVSNFHVRGGGGDGFYRAPSTAVTSGAYRGSTQITVADASIVPVGRMIQLYGDNDLTLPEISPGRANNLRRQNFIVTAKSGNTLTLDLPLFATKYINPQILVSQSMSSWVGIEDMTVHGGGQVNVNIHGVYASWIKNVKAGGASNYTIFMSGSHMSEIRHSFLEEQSSEGTNHAGFLMGDTTGLLFEDNIVLKSFPILEINFGCAGNVFAYNYLSGNMVDSNHGPHNHYNLYEGNVMDGIISDGYFGSESEQTLFRNWVTGKSFGIAVKRFMRNFNIVGNQIGTDGGPRGIYSFGQPNMGNGSSDGWAALSAGLYWRDWNGSPEGVWPPEAWQERDLDVLSSVILRANRYSGSTGYYNGVNESLQSGETLPNSLYLSSKPAFFGDLAWPPFGPNNPVFDEAAIPAGYRYKYGTEAPGSDNGNPPPASSYLISVSKSGTGTGTVSGSGIACGTACTATLSAGSSVNLSALPSSGSEFAGWSGACSGTGSCTFTLNSNSYVSATFNSTATPPPPTGQVSVTTGAASSITSSSAVLSGNITDTGGLSVKSRGFEYGFTTSYGSSAVQSGDFGAGTYSMEVSSLTCNALYHYRAFAYNSNGTSYGLDSTFITPQCSTTDTTPPSAPTNLVATPTTSRVSLTWSPSSDNVGVTGYRIYRDGSLTPLATVSGTSYTDSNLLSGTSYSYGVAAYDAAGNTSAKTTVNVTTTAVTPIAVGSRIFVIQTVKVRSSPQITNRNTLGIQKKGATGTVIGGPVTAAGYTWWQIDYDSGVDGWSAANYISR